MPTISLTYTATQAAALDKQRQIHVAASGTPITLGEYAQLYFSMKLDNLVADFGVAEKVSVTEAWSNASDATKLQIKQMLGLA